jgi:predicted AAA+ superfamily ATPase
LTHARGESGRSDIEIIVETFVVAEVLKQVSWLSGVAGCGHWRTHDGAEVDLVVERDDGRIAGFEAMTGARVRGSDLSGLRILRDEMGDAVVAGNLRWLSARSTRSWPAGETHGLR